MAGMTVSIKITDLEPFQEFITSIANALKREDIPQDLKDEIDIAVNKLLTSGNNNPYSDSE